MRMSRRRWLLLAVGLLIAVPFWIVTFAVAWLVFNLTPKVDWMDL